MAISIDWPTGVIFVPKDYTKLVQSSPTEIRDLDTNKFRLDLKELEWSIEGMPFQKTHNHNPPLAIGGIELARTVEITQNYTVTFEDGLWAVNLKGSNNNILDRTNKNQVSVNPGNSAGLVTSSAIEYGEYGGKVTIDVLNTTGNATSGSIYPVGTLRNPVNNFEDASLIAESKGFSTIKLISDATLNATATFNYYSIYGISHVQTQLRLEAEADIVGRSISNVELTGVLDGGTEIGHSVIRDIIYFNGHIHDSYIGGKIKLGGASDSYISDCARLEEETVPVIDFNNEANDLVMARYAGLIRLENLTHDDASAIIGVDHGRVVLDSSTCTTGLVGVTGIGELVDENDNKIVTGTWNGVTIHNYLISNRAIALETWAYERT